MKVSFALNFTSMKNTSLLFGFFKKVKTREFEATKEFPKGYWNWLELPNHELVPDTLSFQLSAWCKRLTPDEKE